MMGVAKITVMSLVRPVLFWKLNAEAFLGASGISSTVVIPIAGTVVLLQPPLALVDFSIVKEGMSAFLKYRSILGGETLRD